jgi:hypothetical protein
MTLKTCGWVALFVLAGCATQSGVAPREYLDETSAATITVAAKPWVFVEAPSTAAGGTRDFLDMYAIDVNRSGDHRQFLAVLQWWPREHAQDPPVAKTLDLVLGDRTVALDASTDQPGKLGVVRPLNSAAPSGSQWLFFPVDKQLLQDLSVATLSGATLASGGSSTQYATWKDARNEMAAFTTTLR